ncbi:natural cytotoxicity triggering receptor 1-like isoform X2 [Castor canadensis]|uniref:Natural cytotoxicity triggering receptor 1-like isoform X2 n=1 Tax=Castor canadensis TaxID=51338 RepID=A0AC58LB43_CASCN
MPSIPPALLCLGLCLSQRIDSQKQSLPKPTIWAKPNSMVPKGNPVTIWCQGAQNAVEYRLHFEGGLSALERPKTPRLTRRVKFLIPAMSWHTAGRYRCFYQIEEFWSEPSDPLDLVVIGMYDTPTLSVHPGPEVTLGENVTFHCCLDTATSTFFLVKEGSSRRAQHRYGNIQAEFPVGPVSTAHKGTYRCFGSYNNHAWSFPSEPVTLLVTGDVGNTSLLPTDVTSSTEDSWEPDLPTSGSGFQNNPGLWDHTAHNLLRIGLAFLVLVAIVWLVAEDWLSRKRAQERATREARWECRRRWRTHFPDEQPRATMPMVALKAAP